MINVSRKVYQTVLFAVVGFTLLGIVSKEAYSIVDLRVGYSFGNLYQENDKFANETGFDLSAWVQPLFFLPVALDLGYAVHNLELSSNSMGLDYEKIFIGVVAWIPFIPIVTPFVSVRAIPWQDVEKVDGRKIDLKMGYGFVAGIKYKVIPLINVFASFNYELTSDEDSNDYKSSYGTLGVEVDL